MLLPRGMGRRLLAIAGTLALGGCGGGPHLVSHPVETRTFAARPGATCGQELVTTTFVARGARWGEDLDVVVCGAHALSGRIEVTADRVDMGGPFTWTGVFGRERDNRRCLEGAALVTETGRVGGAGASRATGSAGASAAASAAPGATAPAAFEEVRWGGAGDDTCAEAMDTVMELDRLRRGSLIRVRLWSATPNDLARALVRIRHEVERPNVSDAAWRKHLAAEARRREAADRKERAREARSARAIDPGFAGRLQHNWNRSGSGTGSDSATPTSAPPPPRPERRPPRPAATAEWIPGFWRWAGRDWVWIAGRWRAPDPSPPRPPVTQPRPTDGPATGTSVTIDIGP